MDDRQQAAQEEPEAGLTRRERRTAARRAQLLRAAARVFAKKGFHGATTRDIAEAADVAEGTIYNYFENKDALLIGLIDSIASLETREHQMAAGLEQDFSTFLTEHLLVRLRMTGEYTETLQAILPELLARPELREAYYTQVVHPAIAMLERHAEARIAQGEIRPLDVPLAVRAFVGMFLGMWALSILGDPLTQESWTASGKATETIMSMIVDGVRPKEEKP